MALAEYEKRNGEKVVSYSGQIIYFWVPLDTLSGDF